MHRTSLVLLSILLTAFTFNFFSCSKNNEDEKIIPRAEFVELITDLHYADALVSSQNFAGGNLKDSTAPYYEYVLKKHHTTRKSFEKTLEKYADNMKDFLAVYDEVLANINDRIPRKLNDNSIFKIFDLAYEEANIKKNPERLFGINGRTIWMEYNGFSIFDRGIKNKSVFKAKLKYQCLLLLEGTAMVFKCDSSKNLRMQLKIIYTDKTFDKMESSFSGKKDSWNNYHLFLKTNTHKRPDSVVCYALLYDKLQGKNHGIVKNINLRQFKVQKDTTGLVPK